ncbi:MAG: PAS domain-containing protein [Alphaproteobacteria bacterium]|nr:PAS domain-containing protein [Alphaproteobacteria bacterium]
MLALNITPINKEKTFGENELIVSRTDTRGIITYCNRTFINISGYSEAELLRKPHSIIRHPDMPKAVFKLLWDTISQSHEVFAYVKNMSKGGEFYWVLAHVTATHDPNGNIIGYHSNRRRPKRNAIDTISKIYASLLDIELKASSATEGLQKSYAELNNVINSSGQDYNELILSL